MIKTVVKISLILMSIVLFSTPAFAAVLNSDDIRSDVEKKVRNTFSKNLKSELDVKVRVVPFKTLEIPNGQKDITISMNSMDFSPRKIVSVVVKVDGQRIKKFNVPVSLKLYDKVWVATDNIKKGQSLGFNNISLERKDITNIYDNVIKSDRSISDSIAFRNIRSGKIIDKRYVISKPDVSINSIVSVIFETGGIKIAIDAEAMGNASIGDFVRVRSTRYKKLYTGKVISPNKVLVRM